MTERTSGNRILAALPDTIAEAIRRDCTSTTLAMGEVLQEQGEAVETIYLPVAGVVSLVTVMEDGYAAEAALVGREGLVGYPLSRRGRAPCRAIVQAEGGGLAIPLARFRSHLADFPELRTQVDAFTATLLAFSAQSVACNRFHEVAERLSRWLLMMRDRVEAEEFPYTQAFLAQMLGVRRPSVTVAVGQHEQAGFIETRRGRIRILDRESMEAASCECYARIREWYDELTAGQSILPEM